MAILVGLNGAHAVEWDGGGVTNEWNDPANWEFDIVPGFADTATIINDTAAITGTFPPTIENLDVGLGFLPGALNLISTGSPAMLEVSDLSLVGVSGSLALGAGGSEIATGVFTNFGDVTVGVGSQIVVAQEYAQFFWPGTTTVSSTGRLEAAEIRIEQGELRGDGNIVGNLTAGMAADNISTPTIIPGGKSNALDVQGNLVLYPNANLAINVNTAGQTPTTTLLNVSGSAELGGTLNVDFTGGGSIPRNEQIEVVLADSFTFGSSFDDIVITSDIDDAVVATMLPRGRGGTDGFGALSIIPM